WEPGALSDLEQPVRHMLHQLTKHEAQMSEVPALISFLKYAFDDLEQAVEQRDALSVRVEAVGDRIPAAATVARPLGHDERGAAPMVQAYTFRKGDKCPSSTTTSAGTTFRWRRVTSTRSTPSTGGSASAGSSARTSSPGSASAMSSTTAAARRSRCSASSPRPSTCPPRRTPWARKAG